MIDRKVSGRSYLNILLNGLNKTIIMTAQPMVQPKIVPGTLVNTSVVGTIMQISGGGGILNIYQSVHYVNTTDNITLRVNDFTCFRDLETPRTFSIPNQTLRTPGHSALKPIKTGLCWEN